MATISAAQLADELGTDAKTARRFLRSNAAEAGVETPGKGQTWAIEKKDLRSLKSRYAKWAAAQESAKETRKANAAAKQAEPEVESEPAAEETD